MAAGLISTLLLSGCQGATETARSPGSASVQVQQGAIVRGPTREKRLALVFTGHEFGEGAGIILDGLKRHHSAGSFFLTGTFLTHTAFAPIIRRMHAEGHYLGPHSDQHLLYCEWNAPKTTRVTRGQFAADLMNNVDKLAALGMAPPAGARYFLPPFEHYNAEVAAWSDALGWTLINFTPGTRSHADYTGEADDNFVSSAAIFDSILERERKGPHGLNGFILLLHLGSGPGRSDPFHARFSELLDALAGRGYQFIRVDELLAAPRPAGDE